MYKYTIEFDGIKDESQKKLLEAYKNNDINIFIKFWGFDKNGLSVKSDIKPIKDPNFILKAKAKSELDLLKTVDT